MNYGHDGIKVTMATVEVTHANGTISRATFFPTDESESICIEVSNGQILKSERQRILDMHEDLLNRTKLNH